MTQEEVDIPAGLVTLQGTWLSPPAPRATVIFVHGSGPMDRDQNTTTTKLNVFNVLAAALADINVASLRYDKRGIGGSTGDYMSAGQDDLLADLAAVIDAVKSRAAGPVILCGHSEGTALAVAMSDRVDGLVLLCPYVTSGAEILRRQAMQSHQMIAAMPGFTGRIARLQARILGGPLRAQKKFLNRLMASTDAVMKFGKAAIPARWYRDFISADVASLHATNTLPTLVLVAANDAQCPPDDGAKIVALNPNAELVVLDNLSHILRQTTATGLGDYARQLAEPIDQRVTQSICDWMARMVDKLSIS